MSKSKQIESSVGMKIRMDVESLERLLKRARVCGGGKSLPILGCVLLRAEGEGLLATMTNLGEWVVVGCACGVVRAGACVVEAKRLAELLTKAVAPVVDLEMEGDVLSVACGQWKATLHTLEVDEFPPVPGLPEGAAEMGMGAGRLRRWLTLAGECVSGDKDRYVMNGVHVLAKEEGLVMESTDGRRCVRVSGAGEATGEVDVILPSAAVGQLRALLAGADKEGVVRLMVTGKEVVAVLPDGGMWGTRVIEGRFPDVNKVMPGSCPWGCVVERVGFAGLVDRGAVLNDSAVTLRMLPDEAEVVAVSDEHETWLESGPVYGADGGPGVMMEMRVNPAYLRAVGMPDVEMLHFEKAADGGPLKFTASEDGGEAGELSWVLVVMPLAKL